MPRFEGGKHYKTLNTTSHSGEFFIHWNKFCDLSWQAGAGDDATDREVRDHLQREQLQGGLLRAEWEQSLRHPEEDDHQDLRDDHAPPVPGLPAPDRQGVLRVRHDWGA